MNPNEIENRIAKFVSRNWIRDLRISREQLTHLLRRFMREEMGVEPQLPMLRPAPAEECTGAELMRTVVELDGELVFSDPKDPAYCRLSIPTEGISNLLVALGGWVHRPGEYAEGRCRLQVVQELQVAANSKRPLFSLAVSPGIYEIIVRCYAEAGGGPDVVICLMPRRQLEVPAVVVG